MSRWLVTGAVGFVGYHLSAALLAQGDEVVALDDFSPAPYPTAAKRRNAQDLRAAGGPAFSLFEGCVTDRALLDRLLSQKPLVRVREARPGYNATDADVFGPGQLQELQGAPSSKPAENPFDGIVHLAGLAGVRPSFDDPARYSRVNVEGTAAVIEAALRHGLKKVVFASSSSVYGNSTPLPAHEDASAMAPESPYAASKRGAELVASTMSRRAPEMVMTGLRFFTVYGPRQRPEMAMTSWTRALLEGRELSMFGDGSMRRDFTHVDDIVRGVLAALARAPSGYRIYNLGSGAPVDLRTVVNALGRILNVLPAVHHSPVPLGDVEATFADIERARVELGWAPTVTLEEGLRTLVDWVRGSARP